MDVRNDYSISDYLLITDEFLARLSLEPSVILVASRLGKAPEDIALGCLLYYNYESGVSVHDVAVFLGIDEYDLFLHLPGVKLDAFSCHDCGKAVVATSRSQIRQYVSNTRKGRPSGVCPECDATRDEKRRLEREEATKRLENLRRLPYAEYLKSDHWQEVRRQKLRSAGYHCQLCNQPGVLDVHHRTYERLGCERSSDLIVLCRDCHTTFHHKLVKT